MVRGDTVDFIEPKGLVVGKDRAWQHAKVDAKTIRVFRRAVIGGKKRQDTAIVGFKTRALIHVARISQTDSHARLREQCQIVILHPAHQVQRVGRFSDTYRRLGACGIQRVGKEVVVPKILVAPKEKLKVVPFIFVDVQARNVVRIAAISEVAESEIIEQHTFVIHRAHFEGVIEQAHALAKIDEGVISLLVAVDPIRPVAKFNRLTNIVIAGVDALRARSGAAIVLGAQRGPYQEHREQEQETEAQDAGAVRCHGHPYLKNVGSKFDPWIWVWQSVHAWNWVAWL